MSIRQTIRATTVAWLVAVAGWFAYWLAWLPYKQHLDALENVRAFSDPQLLAYSDLSFIFAALWKGMSQEPGPEIFAFVILPVVLYGSMLVTALLLRSGVGFVRTLRT